MISKNPKPLAPKPTKPSEVPGLWGAPTALGTRQDDPGGSHHHGTCPLSGLQDFDHSCFAMLKNHRKTTEATEKENSELEECRERGPEKSADYKPATSSTIVSATGNLPGRKEQRTTRLE